MTDGFGRKVDEVEHGEGFTVRDHPADIGIEAWGKNLGEAFVQAARGLVSIICDVESIEPKEARTVALHGTDAEQLLVRWLSEVLYQYDGQNFMSGAFQIHRFTDTELEATLCGEPLNRAKHRMRMDVKAVTYHQLDVREEEGRWRVVVYFDI